MSTNRRDFLKTTATAGLTFSALPILGAEQRRKYRTAIIGTGWWGMNILNEAMAAGESKIVAMCDVDENQLNPSVEEVVKKTGDQPKKYKDYRELLKQEDPEIVIVATPDHWHPLVTIAAVQAGAHVYVEKPVSHTVKEGQAMVAAARAEKRVVQVGTHRRVSPHNVAAMEFLKEGRAGKIGMIRTFVHYGGGPESPAPNEEPPSGLDWDMWCGPAPLRPFNRKIHPKGFRQFLDYANGTLGDWGIHWTDHIAWWSEEPYPKRISSTGGRPIAGKPVYTAEKQTTDAPDHQVVTFEFENFTATWEHRRFAGNNAEKSNIGAYFYGTKGTMHIGWLDGFTFYPVNESESILHQEPSLHNPDKQNIQELWADFLKAIKQDERPVCDIEIGHRSTNMSLLGVLSYKLGRDLKWDGENKRVINDEEANAMLTRDYRGEWEYPDVG